MNQSILLIEDDQWLADSYKVALTSRGYDVTHLSTAHEAMDFIAKHIPQLVIADVLLGDHNTFTLFHELQSYPDTAKIPVIVCTSLATEQLSEVDLKSYGIVQVFDKASLTPDKLLLSVETHIPERGSIDR